MYAGDELLFYIVDGGYVLATSVPVTNAFDEKKAKKKRAMQLANLPTSASPIELRVKLVLVDSS